MYTERTYNTVWKWDWDPAKALANLKKHRIDFADAVLALEDERGITVEDYEHDERRHATLGLDPAGRLLVVVYTWRAGAIRIISARKANKRERANYGEHVRS